MQRRLRILAIAMVAMIAGACGQAGGGRSRTVTAKDVSGLAPGERIVIDMRRAAEAVTFDQGQGSIAFDRVELVCPNGRAMIMKEWMAEQAVARRFGLADQPSFELSSTPPSNPPATGRLGACPLHTYEECSVCTDGLVVCVDACADRGPPPDTINRFGDIPNPPPSSGGDPNPPQGGSSSGGSSSGSGSSSGGGSSSGSGGGGGDTW